MNELATQGANDVNTSIDRAAINKEISSLSQELGRIGKTTQFNDMNLLNGGFENKKLQVGAKENQVIEVDIKKLSDIASYTVTEDGDVSADTKLGLEKPENSTKGVSEDQNNDAYATAMTKIQADIKAVSGLRSDLGAIQNRLEHTIANLDTTSENTQAAESLIRDTDMASAMVEFSKNNILAQAGQSMLAQANQATQGVMSLLQ
jgi:flagellin